MSNLLSEVKIANLALGWLGEDTITSFADGSVTANLCELNYPITRDTVLEEREWTFAVRRYSLSPTGNDPEYDWAQEFSVPTEILRVLTVDRTTLTARDSEQSDWVLEGDKILSDLEVIYIRAIVRIKDTTKFSPAFTQTVAARLAADLAIPITRSKTLQQQMFSLYQAKLRDAAALDGMQGRSKRIRSRWLTAGVR